MTHVGVLCSLDQPAAGLFLVLQTGRWPAIEAHAEHQPMALQYLFDLCQRLLTQVRGAQELHLGALHQVTDVVDVLGLQAVRATNRKLQLIDRTQQDRIELHLGGLGNRFVLTL
jgi:hypothetical protein